jgi:hypothetical protein
MRLLRQTSAKEMNSDDVYSGLMLRNVLDALVAVGTIALAIVTALLARRTSSSVLEAYESRLDSTAPSLVVLSLIIEKDPVQKARVGGVPPSPITVPAEWDLATYPMVPIGLAVRASLLNEGRSTAFIRLQEAPELDDISYKTFSPDDYQPESEYLIETVANMFVFEDQREMCRIPPGEVRDVKFVWWRTADEWSQSLLTSTTPPMVCAVLDVRNTIGSVRDQIAFNVGRFPLVPRLGSNWIVVGEGSFRFEDKPIHPAVAYTEYLARKYPRL